MSSSTNSKPRDAQAEDSHRDQRKRNIENDQHEDEIGRDASTAVGGAEDVAELELDAEAAQSSMLPELNRTERREVSQRVAISAAVVHETVREEGERELARPPLALAFSGLAAGLSMGFSLIAQGLLQGFLPDAPWRPLVASFGYSLGFLIVIAGRQQLFTENTLTAILPLLAHPSRSTFYRVARLWGIVLVFNLLGAFIFASMVAHTPIFPAEARRAFVAIGLKGPTGGFGLTLERGIFAGWLIALMVWLLPAAQNARLHIIIILTYIVSLGALAHIIAGGVEVFYDVSLGYMTWSTCIGGFLIPTVVGNSIGGVALVAVLNYAQVATQAIKNEKLR